MRWKRRGRVQGSGIGGQGAEAGGRRSEARGQKTEARSQKSEVRSQKSEARSQKPEVRSQKPEARSQKPEVRSQKPEVESRKSGEDFRSLIAGLWPPTSVFPASDLWPLASVFWPLAVCFLLFGDAGAVGAFEEVGADTVQTDSLKVKSPMGAMVRSMGIPGWGQWYNERPIKGAVIFSTELFLGGAMVYEQRRTLDRQQRNTYFLWFLGVFLYNIADAYVDAHLYGFEEDAEKDFQNPKDVGNLQARMGGLNLIAVPRINGLRGYGGDILSIKLFLSTY